jgi:hypothetical protein
LAFCISEVSIRSTRVDNTGFIGIFLIPFPGTSSRAFRWLRTVHSYKNLNKQPFRNISKNTWKTNWPNFWDIPGTILKTCNIVAFKVFVYFKVDIIAFTLINRAGVEFHRSSIPV